jgi:hypothetical protein
MTTAMAFESETRLPKTDTALERAHLAVRELQRTLAERLLAEQESYMALERDYQAVKAERDGLIARLAEKQGSADFSLPKSQSTPALNPLWRDEVAEALALVDQALNVLAPAPQTENAP